MVNKDYNNLEVGDVISYNKGALGTGLMAITSVGNNHAHIMILDEKKSDILPLEFLKFNAEIGYFDGKSLPISKGSVFKYTDMINRKKYFIVDSMVDGELMVKGSLLSLDHCYKSGSDTKRTFTNLSKLDAIIAQWEKINK